MHWPNPVWQGKTIWWSPTSKGLIPFGSFLLDGKGCLTFWQFLDQYSDVVLNPDVGGLSSAFAGLSSPGSCFGAAVWPGVVF